MLDVQLAESVGVPRCITGRKEQRELPVESASKRPVDEIGVVQHIKTGLTSECCKASTNARSRVHQRHIKIEPDDDTAHRSDATTSMPARPHSFDLVSPETTTPCHSGVLSIDRRSGTPGRVVLTRWSWWRRERVGGHCVHVVGDHGTPQGVRFREASLADLDAVLDLLNESAEWLLDRGIRQSFVPFPQPLIENDLRDHRVFLATSGLDDVIATGTALTADPVFWGDQPSGSWYVHRLARRRDAPPGTGRMLLDWIENCAHREGVERIRLDCSAALGPYYEAAGYEWQWSMSFLGSISTP